MLKTISKILLLLIHLSSFLLLGAAGSWEDRIIAFACFIFPIIIFFYAYGNE